VRERLRETLAGVLELAPAEVPEDAAAGTVAGWDSLRHLELMLALEVEYGVSIPAPAMLELVSLEAIEDFLREQGAAPAP
jgi:acyl carrier protein